MRIEEKKLALNVDTKGFREYFKGKKFNAWSTKMLRIFAVFFLFSEARITFVHILCCASILNGLKSSGAMLRRFQAQNKLAFQ